ncbi:uncharacterized protein DNG_00130 [Cephalotrichum gorgonifer]|uniref:Uncharacterized protein n=1 Tax=Cephalotrichum gorgonifer TaxID=2041049 RepID=A0AAE8MNE0_9PEZI|nr:uncharacterized protein DNG_00130 [Cephalotrichum gorgonifer]
MDQNVNPAGDSSLEDTSQSFSSRWSSGAGDTPPPTDRHAASDDQPGFFVEDASPPPEGSDIDPEASTTSTGVLDDATGGDDPHSYQTGNNYSLLMDFYKTYDGAASMAGKFSDTESLLQVPSYLFSVDSTPTQKYHPPPPGPRLSHTSSLDATIGDTLVEPSPHTPDTSQFAWGPETILAGVGRGLTPDPEQDYIWDDDLVYSAE